MTYNGKDNIYFNSIASNGAIDSLNFSFGFSPVSVVDSVFQLPVKITGAPSNNDRIFNVIADTGTTAIAGTHYKFPATFIFHADGVVDSVPITLYRTADEKETAIILNLKLLPTSDFATNLLSVNDNFNDSIPVTTFHLNISDILIAGQYWTGSFQPYFGTFSVKKVRLINQITGMPLDYITILGLYDPNFSARMAYYAITMANYLAQQRAAGHTVYEDDGVTPMTMGASYQ